ncbi:MAG: ABC transporter substrate-binding protein, partial [Alcaligenaceae bacterium]|nr:ABC transporter substrate-binding protein [Alcaligenaceae bacterium]
QQQYEQQGIIQHPAWQDQRIAFQPYPYPSYTVTLVEQLQQMRVDTQNTFLKQLDGPQVATDLVDDRFVKQAINDLGGLRAFGLDDAWERTEWIA